MAVCFTSRQKNTNFSIHLVSPKLDNAGSPANQNINLCLTSKQGNTNSILTRQAIYPVTGHQWNQWNRWWKDRASVWIWRCVWFYNVSCLHLSDMLRSDVPYFASSKKSPVNFSNCSIPFLCCSSVSHLGKLMLLSRPKISLMSSGYFCTTKQNKKNHIVLANISSWYSCKENGWTANPFED